MAVGCDEVVVGSVDAVAALVCMCFFACCGRLCGEVKQADCGNIAMDGGIDSAVAVCKFDGEVVLVGGWGDVMENVLSTSGCNCNEERGFDREKRV